MADPEIVRVTTDDAAGSCDVHVGSGILDGLTGILARVAPAHRYAVISDDRVAELYGATITSQLREHGRNADLFTFPAGESSKTRETWTRLTDAMLGTGFGRDSCVIAIGGGVTGDLAGFVAATYMRGIPFVQVPTSLLAMVDASVGGKVGVDVPAGKNLVGAFAQPRAVVADTSLLRSLPDTDFRSGLAEVVKHGFIADAEHLDWIRLRADAILGREAAALAELVQASVRIKAAIVGRDPLEQGERATLNFGHTIGHALERISGYAMPHGFAVAAGMVVEARIGALLGVSEESTAVRLGQVLNRLGLPGPAVTDIDAVIEATRTDKKGRADRVRYALVARPGRCARTDAGEWTFEVPPDIVRTALEVADVALSQEDTDV